MADEEGIPAKRSKPDTTNETAYYGSGAIRPQVLKSTVASTPFSHQFLCGSQHFMAHFATPVAHASSYPHGGFYAHPSPPLKSKTCSGSLQRGLPSYAHYGMPSSSITTSSVPVPVQSEGKASNGNEQSPKRRKEGSLRNLGLIDSKSIESGKAAHNLESDGLLQWCSKSRMADPSERSEANFIPDESQSATATSDQMVEHGSSAQKHVSAQYASIAVVTCPTATVLVTGSPTVQPMALPQKQAVTGTNLNIRMDSQNASAVRAKAVKTRNSASVQTSIDSVLPQDEHELRRMKRKQSNRESARRSRLRKQEECKKLTMEVEELQARNTDFKKLLSSLVDDVNMLISDNDVIMGRLAKFGDMHDEIARITTEGNDTNTEVALQLYRFLASNEGLDEVLGETTLSSIKRNVEMYSTGGRSYSSVDGSVRSDTT